jgi:putative transposase
VQKALFQKCFNIHRYFYNKAVSRINELYASRKQEFEASETCVHCLEPKLEGSYCCVKHQKKALPWKLNISLISLRKAILKSDKEIKGTDEEWQSEVPYDTRQLAIKDAVSAYKSAVQNKVRGHIQSFTLGYKSRRSPSKLFWIDSNAIKNKKSTIHLFPARLGKESNIRIRKRQRKKLPPSFAQDCKIMKYGKHYYLVYTLEKPFSFSNNDREPIVALDPGVRSFQTGYSPSGTAFKVGEQQLILLKKLHVRLDTLRSRRDKSSSTKKQRLRTRCLDVELDIKNTIANLHNQTGSYLTKTYETILLPEFGTSVMQQGKELRSSTKRTMWTLSHYKFQEKLKGMCNRTGATLYIVKEHYTTKTCGQCGTLQNVGSSEVYKCAQCSYCMDRDVHGARNILLKHITQYGI